MRKTLRSHLTFANVASGTALFVALSTGGAYAASTIGSADIIDESLLSQDFKNGEVKNADLANGSVTNGKIGASVVSSAKVLNNGLISADIQDQTLTAADIAPDGVGASEVAAAAIGTSEVNNGALQTQDFAPGVLARRIDYDAAVHAFNPTQVLSQDGLFIRLDCTDYGASYDASPYLELGSDVAASWSVSYMNRTNGGTPVPASFDGGTSGGGSSGYGGRWGASGTDVQYGDGQIIYRSATKTFTIPFHIEADATTDRCRFWGTATAA